MYPSIPPEKRKHLRVETLKRVVAGYKNVLETKNIEDYSKIESLYRKKRTEILDYIIAKTPEAYRRSDALFEKAVMYWQQGHTEKNQKLLQRAITIWLAIPLEVSNDPTAKDSENLTQSSLQTLSSELRNYLSDNELKKQIAQKNIQRIISLRHSVRITKKRIREETLLWKE